MSTQNRIATHNGILFILRNKDSFGSCNNVAENNIVLNEISNPSKKRQMISVLTHVQKLKQSELFKSREWSGGYLRLGESGWEIISKGWVSHTGRRRNFENVLYSVVNAIDNNIQRAF